MLKLAYITHTANIPSRKADAVCVMKTCASMTETGAEVTLVIPARKGEIKNIDNNVWDFYSISTRFKISYLPVKGLYKLGRIGRMIYKIKSVISAAQTQSQIIYSRHVEIAI